MKKILAVFVLVALLFTGCANKNADTTSSKTSSKTSSVSSKQPITDESVNLTYASWGDPDIEQAMIDEYSKLNPNVSITKDESLAKNDGNWNNSLAALAAAGQLPDIFWIENSTVPLTNKWLRDLTEYVNKDAESKTMLKNLLDMGTYNGKVMILPRGLFVSGIIVNKDLLSAQNIKAPNFNWSTKEFEDILTKSTTAKIQGITDVRVLREILPAELNHKLGWATWDGSKYNFQSSEWLDSVKYVGNLLNKKVAFESLTAEEKKSKFGTEDLFQAFVDGKIAMLRGANWDFNRITDANIGFKWDFYPMPTKSGNPYSRPALVCDYLGISDSTKNPEVAYDFAKWMSYSKDGYTKKMDIVKNGEELFGMKKVLIELPVTSDESVKSVWMKNNGFTLPGLEEQFKHFADGFVDPMKTVPGYIRSYFDTVANQYAAIEDGEFSASDKAKEFNDKANQYYKEAVDAINK